ncbi:unnamed protein product [Euphydryas editha]|uniref:Uncharacterized protein n=1 Tax=Euphydryas editha TaxID=104508 RepID=A0AAU9UYW8_EUPED|nr:unnamed protein product [Euphydryas editha]
MVPVEDLRPGGAATDQVMTFVHELSEARPLRGTAAAVARAPRNGTEAPAASRRPRIPRPPNQPCLNAQPRSAISALPVQLRSRLNTLHIKNNITKQ